MVKVNFGILYIDIPLLKDNQTIAKSLLPVINSSKLYQETMLKLPYKEIYSYINLWVTLWIRYLHVFTIFRNTDMIRLFQKGN